MYVEIKEDSHRMATQVKSAIIVCPQPCDLMLNKVHRIDAGMYLIRVGEKMTVVGLAKLGADHANKRLVFERH